MLQTADYEYVIGSFFVVIFSHTKSDYFFSQTRPAQIIYFKMQYMFDI